MFDLRDTCGPVLLLISFFSVTETVYKSFWLRMARMEMDSKFRLNFARGSSFRVFEKVNINWLSFVFSSRVVFISFLKCSKAMLCMGKATYKNFLQSFGQKLVKMYNIGKNTTGTRVKCRKLTVGN